MCELLYKPAQGYDNWVINVNKKCLWHQKECTIGKNKIGKVTLI